jgi:hypothetical protein
MADPQRWHDRNVRLRIDSMAVLLFLLVLNVFVVPFTVAPSSILARVARDVLLSLILVSGMTTVSDHRKQFLVIALVAIVAILIRWLGWLLPLGTAQGLFDVTGLFALGILCVVIGIKVFSGGTVTVDRILGAIVLYVLIGVVWAEGYQVLNTHVPNAFAGTPRDGSPTDRSTWVYFSFVTLTTVGYGDVTPLAHLARSLAILEALIGQLYPAIVLARLVSLHAASSADSTNR